MTCTCDAIGDGPCPEHGAEMAAQDERIRQQNARLAGPLREACCTQCGHLATLIVQTADGLLCSSCVKNDGPACTECGSTENVSSEGTFRMVDGVRIPIPLCPTCTYRVYKAGFQRVVS